MVYIKYDLPPCKSTAPEFPGLQRWYVRTISGGAIGRIDVWSSDPKAAATFPSSTEAAALLVGLRKGARIVPACRVVA